MFVSTSARFILFVTTKTVLAFQAAEKFCGEAKWKPETKTSKLLGFEHFPQVAQSRIVCVLASLERNKHVGQVDMISTCA